MRPALSQGTMVGMTALGRRTLLKATVASGAAAVVAGGTATEALADPAGREIRIATYNASLNREKAGQLIQDLSIPVDKQAAAIGEVIQMNRPDIVLINEFDYDDAHRAAQLFRANVLEVPQNGQHPITYPYMYTAPVNTGVPTGMDLNHDGKADGPDDAFGFGLFPGQYGMLILSRFPILADHVRTFQKLRWEQMPGNLLPRDYYGEKAASILRLSSKSHWDVPVQIDGAVLHVLAMHPTPPSFDGPEKRNKRRNSDEIRLMADYIAGGKRASYIVDDAGRPGGLDRSARFVVLGDFNSDPRDGDSWPGAIQQLLDQPRIQDPKPMSEGAVEASVKQGGANAAHLSDPRFDTADFSDTPGPGNIRCDYVLPSRGLKVIGSAVFWPRTGQPGAELTGVAPFPTSDHRLVRLDLRLPGTPGRGRTTPASLLA